MKRHTPKTDATAPEVTTEPQRLALEAMSHELVEKLNIMVAEQEKRAREFTNLKHSLSALPSAPELSQTSQTPEPQRNTAPKHKLPPVPRPLPEQPVYTPKEESPLPPIPPYHSAPSEARSHRRKPTVIKGTESQKEEGIGIGTIITVLIIVFMLVAKGC